MLCLLVQKPARQGLVIYNVSTSSLNRKPVVYVANSSYLLLNALRDTSLKSETHSYIMKKSHGHSLYTILHHFYLQWWTVILAWIIPYIHHQVWDEITWPFPTLTMQFGNGYEILSHT